MTDYHNDHVLRVMAQQLLAELQARFPDVRFSELVPRQCYECGAPEEGWECTAYGVTKQEARAWVRAVWALRIHAYCTIYEISQEQADIYRPGWRDLPPVTGARGADNG
jgi:hypothetical protein